MVRRIGTRKSERIDACMARRIGILQRGNKCMVGRTGKNCHSNKRGNGGMTRRTGTRRE